MQKPHELFQSVYTSGTHIASIVCKILFPIQGLHGYKSATSFPPPGTVFYVHQCSSFFSLTKITHPHFSSQQPLRNDRDLHSEHVKCDFKCPATTSKMAAGRLCKGS